MRDVDASQAGRRPWLRAAGAAGLAALGLAVAAVAGVGPASRSDRADRPNDAVTASSHRSPERHVGPQGRVGQFVVACDYSHSAHADPIVHPGEPDRSHRHDFFGATGVDASSRAEDLVDQPTTCDKRSDTAAYWQPTLYDSGVPVEPLRLQAYYRAAPGVDPREVEPYPFGLELLAGDPSASRATTSEAAGWTCGGSTQLHAEPPVCPASAPLQLVLTFPDCWDGEHVRTTDHRSHATYSHGGECPASHPVHLPQLTVSVAYPIHGPGHDLTLSSGSVRSAHGDFLNAWDPVGLRREIEACIHRDVVCDLASNRFEEAPFLHS